MNARSNVIAQQLISSLVYNEPRGVMSDVQASFYLMSLLLLSSIFRSLFLRVPQQT